MLLWSGTAAELDVLLQQLRFERRQLEEKRKQLTILQDLHGNKVPREVLEQLLSSVEDVPLDAPVAEDPDSLDKLREKHDSLTGQLQRLHAEFRFCDIALG